MAEPDIPAGELSSWLQEIRVALRDAAPSTVPCDGCTACCESAQFVHVDPDETDTLAHIPAELLFPAPGRPSGHVLMGYDEHGRCPMLAGGRCSIYDHRPRTCRTYDCRVFPAAGVEPDDQPLAARARRWAFTYADDAARARHAAVRAAAAYVRRHRAELPAGVAANTPSQVAVLAVEVHDAFLDGEPAGDILARLGPDAST